MGAGRVKDQLELALPRELVPLLRTVGTLAEANDMAAYLVGGPVRDALLGRPVADVDIVVEGDARQLAPVVAQELGGRVALHEEFWTATVKLPAGAPVEHIDLATARRETYERPGALPKVEPASIDEDLRRRDFTVNALAAALAPDRFGRLLDPTGGLADLRARLLRAISPTAFIDDATRVIRAAVYAERLDLRVEPETQRALIEAVRAGYMASVTPQRHGEQLRRGLVTDAAGRILLRLGQWGALAPLGLPDQPLWPAALGQVHLARQALELSPEEIAEAAFALAAGRAGVQAAARLALGRGFARTCEGIAAAMEADVLARIEQADGLGVLERSLGEARAGVVGALWAMAGGDVRRRIENWWRQRASALKIDGRDLLARGVPRGPAVGAALQAAKIAALDGRAPDREAQLAVALAAARAWLEQHKPAADEKRGSGRRAAGAR